MPGAEYTNGQDSDGCVVPPASEGQRIYQARIISSVSTSSHDHAFFARYDSLLKEIGSLSNAPAEMQRAQASYSEASSDVALQTSRLSNAKRTVEHYEYKLKVNNDSFFYHTPFQPSTWFRGGRKERISRSEAKRARWLAEVSSCSETLKSAQQSCLVCEGVVSEWSEKVSRRQRAEAEVDGMRSDVVGRNRSAELCRLDSLCDSTRSQRDGDAAVMQSLQRVESLVQRAQAMLSAAYQEELAAQRENAQAQRIAMYNDGGGLEQMKQMHRDRDRNRAAQSSQQAMALLREAFSVIPAAIYQRYPSFAAGIGQVPAPGVQGGDFRQARMMDYMGGGLGALVNDLSVGMDIQQDMSNISHCQQVVSQQLGQIRTLLGHYARDAGIMEQALAQQMQQQAAEASRIFEEVRRRADIRK
jgi:hypothetical protein